MDNLYLTLEEEDAKIIWYQTGHKGQSPVEEALAIPTNINVVDKV